MAVEKKNALLENRPNTEIYANSAFFALYKKKSKLRFSDTSHQESICIKGST